MKSSLIRELVASTKNIPDLISFAGGFPAPATFPKEELAKIFQEVVSTEGSDVLQYGASEGDSILKRELIKWEELELDPGQMLTTVGATNGLYLYGRALIEPGDVVLCEAPTFLGTLVVFDALEADIHSIPIDDEGIQMELLQAKVEELRRANKRIKFIYVIPDFHNPGGISYSLERRRELIAYCIEQNIAIVEDNPYSRLRFSGEALPTFFRLAQQEFNGSDVVTEVVSFSKILGPGLRVAYVKGNRELITKMVSWQQKVNITPDCVSQRVVSRFLEKGLMNPHISRICDHYRPYLNQMLQQLQLNMPDSVTWTKPEGGIFLWLTLPEGMNA
ncbi:MAG TPA: PLP-dependent aminotransferase family protein, partial [Candidatus Cloacimonadota bacterium]|nr:PLP-dependent aminotransferase family protein [Candidatus Cloacimonadota bacterium]